jgi:hypothetical protein
MARIRVQAIGSQAQISTNRGAYFQGIKIPRATAFWLPANLMVRSPPINGGQTLQGTLCLGEISPGFIVRQMVAGRPGDLYLSSTQPRHRANHHDHGLAVLAPRPVKKLFRQSELRFSIQQVMVRRRIGSSSPTPSVFHFPRCAATSGRSCEKQHMYN